LKLNHDCVLAIVTIWCRVFA